MTTYIARPNETNSNDTWISSSAVTTNYGDRPDLYVGESNSSITTRRSLIKMDLSQIPSNAIITSAIITVYIAGDYSSNTRDFKVYRVLRDWVESQATWNLWKTGSSWTTDGCGSDGNDADLTTAWATTSFGDSIPNYTAMDFVFSATGITELQKIIAGAYTNYGWLIKADTESADLYGLFSSSWINESQRPKLTIEYDLPGEHDYGDTPTPAYTQMADLEENDLSEFTGSSGGVATAAAAKYAGTYGLACTLSAAAAYVYWSNLGGATRCVTEFMFDPNSATVANFIPICEIMNGNGDGIFRINAMKSSGQTTYTIAVSTHQYTRQSSYALGSENNVWSMAKWYSNITDAYHKIRINCNLFNLREPSFESLFGGECHLFIDDVFVGSITRRSGPSVGLIAKVRQSDSGITTARYGVTQTPPSGLSGTLYFDNLYESATYSDLIIPQRLVTKSDKILYRASAEGDENWIEPRITELIAGSTGTIKVEFDTGTVTAANVQSYREGRESPIFPASACSVSENIVTTPAYGGLVGNNDYTIEISAVIDGRVVVRRLIIKCIEHGDETEGTFVEPATIDRVAGSSETFEVVFENAEEVSSPSTAAYRDRQTLTTTLFPNGSSVASGNAMITPTMTGLVGDQKYILEFSATIDGYTTIRKVALRAHIHGEEL